MANVSFMTREGVWERHGRRGTRMGVVRVAVGDADLAVLSYRCIPKSHCGAMRERQGVRRVITE